MRQIVGTGLAVGNGKEIFHSKFEINRKIVAFNKEGLVFYIPADSEHMNMVFDCSGKNGHGTRYGTIIANNGKIGKGLYFDGIDDYVDLHASNSILSDAPFTFLAWIRTIVQQGPYGTEGRIINLHRTNTPAYSTGACIYAGGHIGNRDNICFLYCSTDAGNHKWLCYDTSTAPSVYWDGNWHLIAGSHSGLTAKIYYDGVEVGAEDNPYGTFGTTKAKLGSFCGTTRFFKGIIDEIKIFNRVLDQEEILSHYQKEI
jgi:hypothetical protein